MSIPELIEQLGCRYAALLCRGHDSLLQSNAYLMGNAKAALEQLQAEIERLRAIVDKLPKDAEGKPVVEGDVMWVVADGVLHRMIAEAGGHTAVGPSYTHVTHLCYSTADKALAAAEAAKEAT